MNQYTLDNGTSDIVITFYDLLLSLCVSRLTNLIGVLSASGHLSTCKGSKLIHNRVNGYMGTGLLMKSNNLLDQL